MVTQGELEAFLRYVAEMQRQEWEEEMARWFDEIGPESDYPDFIMEGYNGHPLPTMRGTLGAALGHDLQRTTKDA